MVISLRKNLASTKRPVEECIRRYPEQEEYAKKLIARMKQVIALDSNSRILEIGASQGSFLIACKTLGYSCEGVEPSQEAIEVSKKLSQEFKVGITIKRGFAEDIPYDDASFDVVIALFVMEHVRDVERVFNEVFRVLKPRGAFYFTAASSLCPSQGEIRFFPFFSWYPGKIKVQIMEWATRHQPSLIGYTETPAINWFTPWKAKRLLRTAGFEEIYDRWDLVRTSELSPVKRLALKVIRLGIITKILADVLKPCCGFLAVKIK